VVKAKVPARAEAEAWAWAEVVFAPNAVIANRMRGGCHVMTKNAPSATRHW